MCQERAAQNDGENRDCITRHDQLRTGWVLSTAAGLPAAAAAARVQNRLSYLCRWNMRAQWHVLPDRRADGFLQRQQRMHVWRPLRRHRQMRWDRNHVHGELRVLRPLLQRNLDVCADASGCRGAVR